jgi:hypothetical protein
MAGAGKLWRSSLRVTLPGQGHDVDSYSWGACGGPLTQAFVERASVAGLNTGCVASVPAPDFDLPPLP